MAFHSATEPETMTPMSSYEPDPKTAKLFARHKQATETLRDTKKPVTAALEDAIRNGATSPQLAALTGMSTQAIRNIAERIGIDIRVKAPTVGPEAKAARAAQPAPLPVVEQRDLVANLTDGQAAELAARAYPKADPRQYELLAKASADGDRAVIQVAMDCGLLDKTDLLIA